MQRELEQFLLQNSYIPIQSNLDIFAVYFKKESNYVEVVEIIDYSDKLIIGEDGFEHIEKQLEQLFLENGLKDPHIITLLLTNQVAAAYESSSQNQFSWIIDTNEKKLIIPENHVEDFYGFKGKIESFLQEPEKYKKTEIEKDLNQKKKRVPFVNIALVIINVIVFILCAFIGKLLYNKGTFSIYAVVENKELYRFISSMFLHADSDHLISNMIVLLFMGNMVEEKLGHVYYFLLYMLSGIGGGIASAIYELVINKEIYSVGASGAIFGIVGAILILVIVHRGKWETISLPRVICMLVYSLYTGFTAENVNNIAHIGGLITGAIIMVVIFLFQKISHRKNQEDLHEN